MDIIKYFSEFGLMGLVMGLLIYDVFFLQRKLVSIIENNTKAMAELKEIIKGALIK